MGLFAGLLADATLERAFAWVCRRRKRWPACADVWELRQRWPAEKARWWRH